MKKNSTTSSVGVPRRTGYELVANKNVNLRTNFQTDGNLDFAGSSVTEPSKIEGNDDFIANPEFVLQTDGQLRLSQLHLHCI